MKSHEYKFHHDVLELADCKFSDTIFSPGMLKVNLVAIRCKKKNVRIRF